MEGADLEALDKVDVARVVERDQAGLGIKAAEAPRRQEGHSDQRAEEPGHGEKGRSDRAFALGNLVNDRGPDRCDHEPEAETGGE